MKRREFLYGLGGIGALSAGGLPPLLYAAAPPTRGLRVTFDENAPAAIRNAAHSIAEAHNHPLISVLTDRGSGKALSSRQLLSEAVTERAYNHLILVGLLDDPLIVQAWQREARKTAAGFYVFGFGTLSGEIGYVESDRNPFLHSPEIDTAPYETETITITGSTADGVLLAVDAFLKQSLINGVVAAHGWSRPATSLLDRDPLTSDFEIPALAPAEVNGHRLIGLTQAGEDEYRGVLADSGLMPASIWRAKYFKEGVWDKATLAATYDAYSYGLHRRAYGSTRWIATFASEKDASAAAPKIAAAAHLPRKGNRWIGKQPYYGWQNDDETPGPLTLEQHGAVVLMSTVAES